jgi:hypothetical protein
MGVAYSSETPVSTYVLIQGKNLRTRLSSGHNKLQQPGKPKRVANQDFLQ